MFSPSWMNAKIIMRFPSTWYCFCYCIFNLIVRYLDPILVFIITKWLLYSVKGLFKGDTKSRIDFDVIWRLLRWCKTRTFVLMFLLSEQFVIYVCFGLTRGLLVIKLILDKTTKHSINNGLLQYLKYTLQNKSLQKLYETTRKACKKYFF